VNGIYTGFQTRIVAKQPKPEFVHRAAHNLNLVLKYAVSVVIDVKNLFGVVNQIDVFFAHSIRRWNCCNDRVVRLHQQQAGQSRHCERLKRDFANAFNTLYVAILEAVL